MSDATYGPKVYRKQGGDELIVASGGDITVESGGTVTVASGAVVTIAAVGGLKIGSDNVGVSTIADVTATAAEINADLTGALGGAVYTIGTESNDVRTIGVQLNNVAGTPIAYIATVLLGVFSTATGTAFATGGSTGIAIGTDGALLALVAKKLFLVTSETDGDIDLTWTDTGTEAVYLGIVLPNGKLSMSAIIQNAS